MPTDLFTTTAPTDGPGWYWWREYQQSPPMCREWYPGRNSGWWGPKVPLPVAAPVEIWQTREGKCFDWFQARVFAEQYMTGVPAAEITRCVCVPVEIVQPAVE